MTTEADIALIREEIGDASPPTDADLEALLAEGMAWYEVARSVLNKRLQAMATAGSKFSLDGDLSVDNTASIKVLSDSVKRLRTQGSTGSGRLVVGNRER